MATRTKREPKDTPPRAAGDSARIQEVTALVRLMDENHLVEIEIEDRESRIRLVKDHGPRHAHSPSPSAGLPEIVSGVASPPSAERSLDGSKAIISPMVGTFYRSPNPESPAFVDVGTIVEKGDTLCIIEAMKMMNEIEAEFRGRVARIVASNGQTVEYGESLFLIEPL